MARVDVLLPVYRAEATLALCLRSLRRQRFGDWRALVVDDGSDDASLAIAQQAASEDPRIHVLARPHEGLVAALNAGLEACDAPVVARMDADDIMHRDRLGAQIAALDAHPDWVGVGCHVRLFPRAGLSAGRRAYETWLNSLRTPEAIAHDALVECPLAHPTWALRRAPFATLGYRAFDGPEDHDLLLRLLGAGHRLGTVPRRLHLWRDGPERLSRNDPRYALERFTALRASHLAEHLLAAHDDYVLWGYGGTGKALCRALREHAKAPRLIVERHPGRIGQRIAGAPVKPPESLAAVHHAPVVVSVAGAEARAEIRGLLATWGYREGRDFAVCA